MSFRVDRPRKPGVPSSGYRDQIGPHWRMRREVGLRVDVAWSKFGLARSAPGLTRSPRSFIFASCLSHSHDSSFTRCNITTTPHSSADTSPHSYSHIQTLRLDPAPQNSNPHSHRRRSLASARGGANVARPGGRTTDFCWYILRTRSASEVACRIFEPGAPLNY